MFNVAVIGCGIIGKLHAKAYKAMDDVNLCAFIDTNSEMAEALAAEFGGHAYKSLDDVPEKLDLVSVVTPPATHYQIVMDLLERRIPVFCEKPITMDIEQAKEIVKKSEETGIQVGIGFKMRNERVFAEAKKYIKEIGDVFAVSAVKNQPGQKEPAKAWIKGVGCMYELSVHEYDLIDYIADIEPISVSAKLGYANGWEREDRAFLNVEYTKGITGQLCSSYTPDNKWSPMDLTLIFVGTKGTMRVERPNKIVLNTTEYREIDIEPINGEEIFNVQMRKYLDALKEGRKYVPGAHEGYVQTLLIESAVASDKNGGKKIVL